MAKLLCSVLSGPHLTSNRTYFNKPVNLAFVSSVDVGEYVEADEIAYFIDFEGINVRWSFASVEDLQKAYEEVINHEY